MSWNNKNKNNPIQIQRRDPDELNVAIEELEKRGYQLIRRGFIENKDIGYDSSRTDFLTKNAFSSRRRLLDPVDTIKYYAIMKKEKISQPGRREIVK